MNGLTDNSNCERCRELENEIAKLCDTVEQQAQKIKDLEKQVEKKARASKRQAAPFRRNKKKPPEDREKPGRKPGHAAAHRQPPEKINRTIDVPAGCCPDCQVPVENVTTHIQYQTDIPPVEPVVTQFNVEVGFCPCCGQRVQGQHLEQTSQALGAAAHTLGPRAVATAADFKYRLGMPFRKIADVFGRCFKLSCCASALSQATARLAERAEGVLDVLKMQLPAQPLVHADETSWWVGGEKAWLHTFATDQIVVFAVGGRGSEMALDVLGTDFAGRVACDGYDCFSTTRCNAHPLRRIRDLLETDIGDRAALEEIQAILQNGLSLRDRREELTDLGYRRLVTVLKDEFHDWIHSHEQHADDAIGRLARHLGRYEEEFLVYLDDPLYPATNNYAEGTLRFAVLLRKVGCGNRTASGVRTFEVLSSLLATFSRREKDFIGWSMELLQGTDPKYVPPDLLPPGFPYQITLT